jgi:acyl carrier protein
VLETPMVEPATSTEKTLARLWCQVLELEQVGIHDDFAELGGDSLQAIDVITRVEELFALRQSASLLMEAQTVAQMARRIEAMSQNLLAE